MLLVGPRAPARAPRRHLGEEPAPLDRSACADAAAVPGALAPGVGVEDQKPSGFDERALFHLMKSGAGRRSLGPDHRRTRHPVWSNCRDLAALASARRPVVSLLAPDDQLFRAHDRPILRGPPDGVDEAVVGYLATRIERPTRRYGGG